MIALVYFFALSGFGLTYKDRNNGIEEYQNPITLKSMVRFAKNRMKKIYPLYLITMAVSIPYSLYLDLVGGSGIVKLLLNNVVRIILTLTMTQSLFGCAQFSHIYNIVCWFLSTLCICYFFYPLIAKANTLYVKKKGKEEVALVLVFFIRILIYYIFKEIETVSFFNDLSYGSPYLRIFDFMLGVLLCDVVLKHYQFLKTHIGTTIEVCCVCVLIVYYLFRNSIMYDFSALLKITLDVIVALIVIGCFSVESGEVSRFLQHKFLVYLGDSAMYVYLFHYPLRICLRFFGKYLIGNTICLNIFTIVGTFSLTAILIVFISKYKSSKVKNGR